MITAGNENILISDYTKLFIYSHTVYYYSGIFEINKLVVFKIILVSIIFH